MTDLSPGIHIEVPDSSKSLVTLASHRYRYVAALRVDPGKPVDLPLRQYTAVVLRGRFMIGGFLVEKNQVIRGNSDSFAAVSRENGSALLVAGVEERGSQEGLECFPIDRAKKVTKPWGHEFWLSGEGRPYSLKMIRLNCGHRTSLQFHRQKRETNYILEGRARLTMQARPKLSGTDPERGDNLLEIELAGPVSLDIQPRALHRITAGSDLTMFEASTPELDDVVRVADDAKRGNGRISTEH